MGSFFAFRFLPPCNKEGGLVINTRLDYDKLAEVLTYDKIDYDKIDKLTLLFLCNILRFKACIVFLCRQIAINMLFIGLGLPRKVPS